MSKAGMEKTVRATARADLAAYARFMVSDNPAGCLAIERRWGLEGQMPETVCVHLADQAKDEA
jgi:hypothetical protein